jgi:hypothetical protein
MAPPQKLSIYRFTLITIRDRVLVLNAESLLFLFERKGSAQCSDECLLENMDYLLKRGFVYPMETPISQ